MENVNRKQVNIMADLYKVAKAEEVNSSTDREALYDAFRKSILALLPPMSNRVYSHMSQSKKSEFTAKEISNALNVVPQTASYHLALLMKTNLVDQLNPDVKRNCVFALKGRGNPDRYKDAGLHRFRRRDGYVFISTPRHPRARGWSDHVQEHIIVMEEHIGRHLKDREVVHHKNGIRHDNRIENLELWVRPHPPGQRVSDLVEWATEFLREYAPERLSEEWGGGIGEFELIFTDENGMGGGTVSSFEEALKQAREVKSPYHGWMIVRMSDQVTLAHRDHEHYK